MAGILNKETFIVPQLCFFVSIAFGFIALGMDFAAFADI